MKQKEGRKGKEGKGFKKLERDRNGARKVEG